MSLQSSGAISLSDIQTEFGGTNPISVSEYYKDGENVPSTVAETVTASSLSTSESGGNAGWGGVFWRYYENGSGPIPTINSGSNIYISSFWTDVGWTSGNSTSDISLQVDTTGSYIATVGGYNTGGTRSMTVYVNGTSQGSASYGSVSFTANSGDTIRLYSTMNTISNYNACTTTLTTDNGDRDMSVTVNTNVPTSGVIDMSDFYDGQKNYE